MKIHTQIVGALLASSLMAIAIPCFHVPESIRSTPCKYDLDCWGKYIVYDPDHRYCLEKNYNTPWQCWSDDTQILATETEYKDGRCVMMGFRLGCDNGTPTGVVNIYLRYEVFNTSEGCDWHSSNSSK